MTTRDPLQNIDEDSAARGNAQTEQKDNPGYAGNGEEADDEGIPAGTLPRTGNLPNELFHAIGGFVAVLGLLLIFLQKLEI